MHIMENNRFKVIIVEDVKLELKGTEEIFRHEIPNAEGAVARYGFIGFGLGGIDYHRCGNLFFFTEELSGYEGADFHW